MTVTNDLGKDMAFNPFLIKKADDAKNMLKDVKGLYDMYIFCNTKKFLPFINVVKYILVLYSKDSWMNKKPMRPLEERQVKAAIYAGFEQKNGRFNEMVYALMELNSDKIFYFTFNYLIYQNDFLWSEICTLEQQMIENQKIRMKFITGKTDSDFIKMSKDKAPLTNVYREWYKAYQEYLGEFFGDHVEIKTAYDIHKAGLASIETFAR
jgi:hypothetical protein